MSRNRLEEYRIGIMLMRWKGSSENFEKVIERVSSQIENELGEQNFHLNTKLFSLDSPSLPTKVSRYTPLELLQLGISENIEQNFHLLILITRTNLLAREKPYTLALPSPVTKIGIVSSMRIEAEAEEGERLVTLLKKLILHTLGHLWNLPHHHSKTNIMFNFSTLEELEKLSSFTPKQLSLIREEIEEEGKIEVAKKDFLSFVLQNIWENWSDIIRVIVRANPLRLTLRMPAMVTAALSVTLVLFFSSETWDLASTVEGYQLVIFAFTALFLATALLYRTFTFGPVLSRDKALTESTVVSEVAVFLSLILTVLVMQLAFLTLFFVAAQTIFPQKLMRTWPTVDPAVKLIDHLKLSLFLSSMAVLAGSLGGRSESKDVIRHILFIEEET